MKSLEKVNRVLIRDDVDSHQCLLSNRELKTIQQSLEVLEIIRKKRVDVAELVGCLIYFDNDEDVLEDYNSIRSIERQLTLTELLKLKQWLEVNDNESI